LSQGDWFAEGFDTRDLKENQPGAESWPIPAATFIRVRKQHLTHWQRPSRAKGRLEA